MLQRSGYYVFLKICNRQIAFNFWKFFLNIFLIGQIFSCVSFMLSPACAVVYVYKKCVRSLAMRYGAWKQQEFHLYSVLPPAALSNPDWLLIFFTDSTHLLFPDSSWTGWLKQVN